MTASLKSALTLLALGALLVIAAVWGWHAVTKPFPSTEPPPLCTDVTVNTGTEVFRDQVAVSVFNGSNRNGLAGATMAQLEQRGFVGADSDNGPGVVVQHPMEGVDSSGLPPPVRRGVAHGVDFGAKLVQAHARFAVVAADHLVEVNKWRAHAGSEQWPDGRLADGGWPDQHHAARLRHGELP